MTGVIMAAIVVGLIGLLIGLLLGFAAKAFEFLLMRKKSK